MTQQLTTRTSTSPTQPVADDQHPRRVRARSVAVAVAANAVFYLLAAAAGVSFHLSDPGSTEVVTLTFVTIVTVSLTFGLLGWAALALLERFVHRPGRAHRIWKVAAISVLVLSYVPIGIEQASAGTRVSLAVIHTVVAIALWPMLQQRNATRR